MRCLQESVSEIYVCMLIVLRALDLTQAGRANFSDVKGLLADTFKMMVYSELGSKTSHKEKIAEKPKVTGKKRPHITTTTVRRGPSLRKQWGAASPRYAAQNHGRYLPKSSHHTYMYQPLGMRRNLVKHNGK